MGEISFSKKIFLESENYGMQLTINLNYVM